MRSLFLVAIALVLLSTLSLCTQHTGVRTSNMATTDASLSPSVPEWYTRLKSSTFAEKLNVREWQDEAWRQSEGGWKGKDYVHSVTAPCRILEYSLIKPQISPSSSSIEGGSTMEFPSLTGVAYFSPLAESHKGFCHGGSLCALMDDCVGWLGFCASGKCEPWSGYTVQIDTTLKKPIPVGALLKVEGVIESVERRKVWIKVNVTDETSGCVHGTCRGLFLLSKEESVSSSLGEN